MLFSLRITVASVHSGIIFSRIPMLLDKWTFIREFSVKKLFTTILGSVAGNSISITFLQDRKEERTKKQVIIFVN
jgi:hypothetical protein